MRKLLLAAALAATCAALPAYAVTDADCQAMWKKADVNNDGMLSDTESMRYAAAILARRRAHVLDVDGNMLSWNAGAHAMLGYPVNARCDL